jgi:hydroxymethylbilane synthase
MLGCHLHADALKGINGRPALSGSGLAPGEWPLQAPIVRIGTRGSPLALAQAGEVRARLQAAHGASAPTIELRVIKTSGDRILDRPLSEAGGKGLFTKEIEDALLGGEIDLAVHSMKDMPTVLPAGLTINCLLPREDARDAFVSLRVDRFSALPKGAVLATSSLRRQAQVKRLRPDLTVVPMRGNVETRLRKLAEGVADATLLAVAGLKRLGLQDRITSAMPIGDMLPAVAQGVIGVETRVDDFAAAQLLAPLHDQPTALSVAAERAFLAKLDGSCRTPIAGLAVLTDNRLLFRGMILTPDGSQCHETSRSGRPEEAIRLAEDAATDLLARAGPDFFAALT